MSQQQGTADFIMMFLNKLFFFWVGSATAVTTSNSSKLRVENFINSGPSLDMVSSLIIGSEAAVLIDMPLAVPQAEALAAWVANTTDKPLVAAFSTHFHPDHYLSGAALLAQFPETKYYANSRAVALIKNEAQEKVCRPVAATFPIVLLILACNFRSRLGLRRLEMGLSSMRQPSQRRTTLRSSHCPGTRTSQSSS
jgi:hypothetical protein